MKARARLTPYVLLGVLTLGTGLGIGLGLSEAPTSRPFTSANRIPSPQELTNVLVFDFNGIRLSPPPNVNPPISPAEAWKAAHVGGASTYRLVLAQWSSTAPLVPSGPTRALVWLVFGTHVAVIFNGGPPSSDKHPGAIFEEGMWPVDATTGQTFGMYRFSSKEVADLAKELRPT